MYKSVSKNTITLVVAIIFAMVSILVVLVRQPAIADDGKDHNKETSQAESNDKKTDKVTYNYTAQAGDSYSQFARKAIQTYGKINKVNLSQAQIVYAETTMTLAAGSPVLNEGEKRSIDESSVKEVVEKAGKLSEAQKAAWNVYTAGVNFNTDKVGERK